MKFGWIETLLWIAAINFVWNLAFCTAVISLQLAAFGMLWTKLKWLSIAGYGFYFRSKREWMLAVLTFATPIVLPAIGNVVARPPTTIIQEIMALSLGLAPTDPSPQTRRYLDKIDTK
jgi:hypothetical protein